MKFVYFAVLLLTFIATSTLAFEEFTDSRGVCWRCYPGKPCERCPRFQNAIWPVGWSDMCFEPNCNLAENRRFLFPSRQSDRYFRCVFNQNHWTHEVESCRCGTLFNMRTQECVGPRNWMPYCTELITPIMMSSCETGMRIVVIGNEPEPVAEESTTVTVTVTFETEATEATTTEGGGEDDCKCIPWFPCWCNPCWLMPCHSCSGCSGGGMMGGGMMGGGMMGGMMG